MPPLQRSWNLGVTKIDQNIPFYKDMDTYILVKSRCLDDYHHDLDWTVALEQASMHLTKHPRNSIVDLAIGGDPEAVLDVAVRYLSGCGRPHKSPGGALLILDAFMHPDSREMPYVGHTAHPTQIAQAHSLAVHAYLDKLSATPAERAAIAGEERLSHSLRPVAAQLSVGADAPAFANFVAALHHANESAKLGHVSPAVLRLGFMMRDIGSSLGVDLTQTLRSRRFRPVWRALNGRLGEIYTEERKRLKKMGRAPNAYACAAEGCGIRAEGRAALRVCAGMCPPDLKPHYCSKGCQKQDWTKHKQICKPGTAGNVPSVTSKANRARALALFELGEPEDCEDETGESVPSHGEETSESSEDYTKTGDASSEPCPPGPGRAIDIEVTGAPGGSISIASDTLDAEMLKNIRKGVTKLMRGGERH